MVAIAAVAVALLAGAQTPHAAVQRFIANHTPADACAQLAPAYKASLAKQYGPCIAGMRHQPKATHIRTSAEKIAGSKATVIASYDVGPSRFKERYALVRSQGAWLITGSKQIP
jgi:hypothetical protein